ncbi:MULTISPECIES: ribosome small subunit-dependent GTPase A [unclassified Luteibacter]|uniref:ribosome small subunit-dependent GTPase A n=1 Tax=unclassified Luteibacter TaxID=2620188 RepID=UPI0008D2AC0F|nr:MULTISPECIES: ribosome small subunit-dependent GTPase A [unclassified Luteibacter]MDR6937271.1 ribosome biogenesis GTPase [Luteibacter sp. 3190]SEW12080.1 ribosome biogenesis GTPase [Luteibacter sp. 329MFSha]
MTDTPDLARLRRIGWRDPALPDDPRRLARVVAQHRAGYEVHDGSVAFNAQPAGVFLKRGLDPSLRPAVGDFVLLDHANHPVIEAILPRRSVLTRAAAGERYERQIIATNIDHVLVLTGLDGDFNPSRIERYLTLVEGSGARPVVLLGKADTGVDVQAALDALVARLPADAAVHAINAKDPSTVALLAPYLGPGMSAVLVGSSGAGKSTLTNTLLGEERMATGAVRSHDSRGRHTTTHRALLSLPTGGCLIDTPGMRELKLTGEENLDLFADIEALAAQCRFADCSHGNEPGCAIQAALSSGELSPQRWRNYLKLHDEREEQAATLEARLKRKAGPKHGAKPRRGDWSRDPD